MGLSRNRNQGTDIPGDCTGMTTKPTEPTPKYNLTVKYAQVPEESVMGEHLSADQVEMGVYACLSDMMALHGSGITRFAVTMEGK